ncbi:MAG: PAS domain S-box protein [Rhodothermales bacterium]|nr:PAS domain S-box protein [Rhodothermales bacterium]
MDSSLDASPLPVASDAGGAPLQVLIFQPPGAGKARCTALLDGQGYAAEVFEDAAAAAAAFAERRHRLVVLEALSDDALTLCRRIRQAEGGEAPLVLALAEAGDQAALMRAVEAEVDDLLPAAAPAEYMEACLRLMERRARKRARHLALEAELAQRLRQQAAVAELGRRGLAGTPVQEALDFAVEAVAAALEVELCKVLICDDGAGDLRLVAGVGWAEGVVGEARVPAGEDSQAGFTLQAGAPVVVEHFEEETRFGRPALLAEHGVVSGVSVPLHVGGAPYGVLGAHARRAKRFTADDVHFIQAVGHVLSGAIERHRAEQALRESEARARAILDTTVDGIITIDAQGGILSFNPAAERIFGYDAGEVLGKNVRMLMPQPFKEEHDGYIQSYHETGRRKIIGIGREVTGRRKDGTVFPMDLGVSDVALDGRVIFTGVVRDVTERRQLEQQILRVSEEERRRIGQDLHDGLGQMLTGIGLIAQSLARTLEAQGLPEADDVAEITEMIREADQFARALARGLVPVDLEANGLASALERLTLNAEKLFGIRCTFETAGEVRMYDNTAATHLFRIAQEAVSNAVKHGRARHVRITLAAGERQARLRIHDDGVGFPDELDEERRGMGVRIMHHRARVIGASLEITDALGGGTVLTCTLRRPADPLPMGGQEYGVPDES